MRKLEFVHLHVHSPFSFLDGASSLKDLAYRTAQLEMDALALTDHDNLCGAVALHKLAGEVGIKPILGAEVTLAGGYHLVLLAKNPRGYRNLCCLLTEAHLGNPRGTPQVSWSDLVDYCDDLVALSGCRQGEIPQLLLAGRHGEAEGVARRYREIFREDFYLELEGIPLPGTRALNANLEELGRGLGIRRAITGNVHYCLKEDFPCHDLLTCVRTGTTLAQVHPQRRLNGENFLRSPGEMAALWGEEYPEALATTGEIAAGCEPALQLGQQLFPAFSLPPGQEAPAFLRRQVFAGAGERYPTITREIEERLEDELAVIRALGYADYFLLVWDLVRYARRRGIPFAGRGSAADSAVAYCLGITQVDAIARGLLFERFMSLERAQKPDIDIDFDYRYRDQVAEYLRQKYGEDRVAGVCTYNTFRARSAVRELGKALGFSLAELDALAKHLPHYPADAIQEAIATLPELKDSNLPLERYQKLFAFCERVAGFPRFLGTHLGGVVIAAQSLQNLVPLQQAAKGITVTQLDKEYVEDLGLVKLDLLSLRTLAVVEDTVKGLGKTGRGREDYDRVSPDDPETYAMLNRGDTIGVFQLESPAQRALQARLGARKLEDIIASVALIRPGPIKGNMVEPYIARRHGQEPVTYLHPKLEPILAKTYGVVLFQEQVIEIATAVAGFTPGEADRLRRVMTHARSRREMEAIGEEFIAKAQGQGLEQEKAEKIFATIAGYASYGFCEAHAAAFGNIAYKTAYLLRHHPAHFYAALLSHQPLGYYPPQVLCSEARRRGIQILPPAVNRSGEAYTVEEGRIRVGLGQVKGLGRGEIQSLLAARREGPFTCLGDFCRRTQVELSGLENLIRGGAFACLEGNRRALLLQAPKELEGSRLWREGMLSFPAEGVPLPEIPDFSPVEKMVQQYQVLGIHLGPHPLALHRPQLKGQGVKTTAQAKELANGARVQVAGFPLRPHRPPTKSGRRVVFLSLEDEEGLLDVTVFEDLYQRRGVLLFGHPRPLLLVTGILQRRGRGVSLVAEELEGL